MWMKRTLSLVLVLCMVVTLFPIAIFAEEIDSISSEAKEDAMNSIKANFSSLKIGETQVISDDGYIGIPVELSIYYDSANGEIVSGYGGTPIIIYVVNACIERVGTDEDTTIISSMLERGYVVCVLDYKNNEKATTPSLDWSVQGLRLIIRNGTYFTDPSFPKGTYHKNYVVPAGYNILMDQVFWEADKHGAEGTFDKILESWNNDMKAKYGDRLIKWVHNDGSRKTVATASDGTAPVWYNASEVIDANGEYTKVKYTVAEAITDCVNPDGTPIDLNAYIDLVYPTNPKAAVPVMALASSAGYLASATQEADRAHMNGFLFNGYAGAVYDHLYVPMARNDSFGYYDGSAGSGDYGTYTVHLYNTVLIMTAAMRYLRHIDSVSSDMQFDHNAMGYFGNSKGGGMTHLGDKMFQSPLVSSGENFDNSEEHKKAISSALTAIAPERYPVGHHGETRFESNATDTYEKDGAVIDGAELQPWLTYENGEEIISGAQWVYSSCGINHSRITEGSVPLYIVAHTNDQYNSAYSSTNSAINVARTMDVPTLFFEVPLKHTFTSGLDLNYGVDTYDAMFDYAGFYLKNSAVKVVYTDPQGGGAAAEINTPIAVAFSGEVSSDEIEKISVTDSTGTPLSGYWTSEFSGMKWFFHPHGMKGSEKYTVTVPSTLKGENGVAMGEEYTASFYTEYDSAEACGTVRGSRGDYIYFNAPVLQGNENRFVIRFNVNGNAANLVGIYPVSDFNATSPDSSTVGSSIGSVNLCGAGYYEVDVTEYVANNVGEDLAFLVKAERTVGESILYKNDFTASLGKCKIGSCAEFKLSEAPDGTSSVEVIVKDNEGTYNNVAFYGSASIYINDILSKKISPDDYGRKYKVVIRIYDTVSRNIVFSFSNNTSLNQLLIDYQERVYTGKTVAGEWTEFVLESTVRDPDFGPYGLKNKSLTVFANSTGDHESPFYIGEVTVIETVTDIDADSFEIAAKSDMELPYKQSEASLPIAIFENETKISEYDSWKAALSAYKYGQIIKFQANYTLTDNDLWGDFATNSNALGESGHIYDIDLNGYTIRCENTSGALLWLKSTSAEILKTTVNIYNGGVLLKSTPLIAYDNSTASGAGKAFEINASDLHIGINSRLVSPEIVSSSDINAEARINASIILNNCELSLPDRDIVPTFKTVFPASTEALTLNYRMNGGCIKLSSARWFTIREDYNNILLGKDADGIYPSVMMPACSGPNLSDAYRTDDAIASLSQVEVVNNIVIYQPAITKLSTKYGIIPEEYADTEKYPFVIFDGNGSFLGASNLYAADAGGGIINHAVLQKYGEWFVLLRRDFVHTAPQFNNAAAIYGSITLDLNGFTFSCQQDSNNRWLESYGKRGSVTNYTIKNGTVEVGVNPLIRFNASTTSSYDGSVPKTWNYVFDNVKFTDVRATSLVTCVAPNILVYGNVTMRDCTLDLTEAPEGFTMFSLNESTGNLCSTVIVEGGMFTSETDLSNVTLSSPLNEASTVKAIKNSNGEYPKVTIPAGASAPGIAIDSDEGNMCFIYTSTDGTLDTYTLAKNPLVTKYGSIPLAYASVTDYPFAVFKDGQFIGAYNVWCQDNSPSALSSARDVAAESKNVGKTVTILVRSNYATDSSRDGIYNNLSHFGATLVIDLDGNTFTVGDIPMLRAKAQTTGSDFHDTYVQVKNGRIVVEGSQVVIGLTQVATSRFDVYSRAKILDFRFDGVVFETSSGNSIIGTSDDANHENGAIFNYTFNDCVFDASGASSNTVMLDGRDSKQLNVANFAINGGSIIGFNPSITLIDNDTADNAVFDKYDGTYTMLTVISGSAPADYYDTAIEGKAFFKATDNPGEYVLTPCMHSYDNACDVTCNDCGATRTVPDHDYSIPKKDATHHWNECSCGEIDAKTAHTYNVINNDDVNHWNECSCGEIDADSVTSHFYNDACDATCACGNVRTAPHSYKTTYETDDGQHWIICESCGAEKPDSRTEHSYDDLCDTDCACGNVRTAPHSYKATYETDDGQHWIICESCDAEKPDSRAQHAFENVCDTDCVCGYTREVIHTYDGSCDVECNVCGTQRAADSNHVYENTCDTACNVCNEPREIEHTYTNACDATCDVCNEGRTPADHTGGAATCTSKAVCTECGAEYGEYADHVYGTKWLSDDVRHWRECSCGSKADEAEHTFGAWVEKDGKRTQSCECGYTVSDPDYKAKDSLSVGAVVGITVGSVTAACVAGFGIYWFLIKKKKSA